MASRWMSKGNSCVRVSFSSALILSSEYRSESRKVARFLLRLELKVEKKKEKIKRLKRRRQDKKRRETAGRQRIRIRNEERRKPRKRDEGKERRLPWRLIVSENPSSHSFCFRFYFLPSNPPVHCLPFVHTISWASPIPTSRDFYLVTFQAFLLPI